jgi:hypothetical protein
MRESRRDRNERRTNNDERVKEKPHRKLAESLLPVRLAQGGLGSGVDPFLAPRPAWLSFPVRPASFFPTPKTPESAETRDPGKIQKIQWLSSSRNQGEVTHKKSPLLQFDQTEEMSGL